MPPMAPDAFEKLLEEGVASGKIKFTHKGDVALVARIYRAAFLTEMGAATELSYIDLHWSEEQMVTLCEALRYAHEEGALANLKTLFLSFNKIGDRGVAALASVLQEGAMPNLEGLSLERCGIGEAGMAALASAIAEGAAPSCKGILLGSNPGSAAAVKEVAAPREGLSILDK